MVDETFIDTFGDQDLADQALLPVGRKMIGEVTAVSTKDAMPGSFRKFEKPLKDGRMEVPIISMQIRARKFADGQPIEGNVNTFFTSDFWVGATDVIGRNSYARLGAAILGMKKEELAGKSLIQLASDVVGGKVTFEVIHRKYTAKDGTEVTQQGPAKLKAASAEEAALLV